MITTLKIEQGNNDQKKPSPVDSILVTVWIISEHTNKHTYNVIEAHAAFQLDRKEKRTFSIILKADWHPMKLFVLRQNQWLIS